MNGNSIQLVIMTGIIKDFMHKLIFVIFVSLLSTISLFSQSQNELNNESMEKYRVADDELNRVYQQILEEYSSETSFIEKLRNAQRNWILFRDSHVEALYPAKDKEFEYGSAYTMCYFIELTKLTKERTKQLMKWLEGVDEGELCQGSIKKR